MLDIQGQPTAAAQPAVQPATTPQQPAAPKPALAMIPSVGGNASAAIQWTLGFVVLIFVLAGGYLSFTLAQKQSEVSIHTKDVKALRQELGKPDRVKAEATANQLKQAVAVLQSALSATSPWSDFLKELTSRVPDSVTLTNLATSDGFAVRMNGTAKSYDDLAQFITALKGSDKLTGVTLESGTLNQSQTASSTVTFSAKATYAPATSVATTSTSGGTNGAQ